MADFEELLVGQVVVVVGEDHVKELVMRVAMVVVGE